MTDPELIAASRRGHRAAFGELVERYQRVVLAVSYSGTGDHALGEDVAQDTFVMAWRRLDRLRDPERVRPWLCGIARNLARRARARRDREAPAELEAIDPMTPLDAASEREAERLVAAALARIPERYREALVLYYFEQQSVREVAAALGVSEDLVHQRLSRGRRYLADHVAAAVERTLAGKRVMRDLAAAVLAAIAIGLPARSLASARPIAYAGITAAIGVAVWRTAAVAPAAPKFAAAANRASDEPRADQSTTPPQSSPKLPDPDPPRRMFMVASIDPETSCSWAAYQLVQMIARNMSVGGDEIAAHADEVADKAGRACAGPPWTELYVQCLGSRADILAGEVTCGPWALDEQW